MGLPYGENFIILTSTAVFVRSTRVTDRQTDRRAIAYTRYSSLSRVKMTAGRLKVDCATATMTIPLPYLALSFLSDFAPEIQLRCLGEHCKLPSNIWDETLAEIDFGALALISDRYFNDFFANQLAKFDSV